MLIITHFVGYKDNKYAEENMEKFEIVSYTDKEIILTNAAQVDKLYRDLHNEDAVQLCWTTKDGKKQSVVIITTTVVGRVKNNETVIRSEERTN